MSKLPHNEPPCSEWSVWKGPEVEGSSSTGRGVGTLFIRSLADFKVTPEDDLSFLQTRSKCSRVWFCREFTNWPLMLSISQHFSELCIEVEPKNYDSIPVVLRQKARIFIKAVLRAPLKDGDVVCVGLPFEDEAFEIGTGHKVIATDYGKDIKIF